VTDFITRHVAQNRSPSETIRILRREVLPFWGGRQVREIRKPDVIALIDRVRERGAPIMANRVLAAVRKFFNWCIGRGLLEISPSAGVPAPAKEKPRHRMLDDAELRAVLSAARGMGPAFGSIVQFLALTGQRRHEVGRLTWNQVDLQRSLWSLPSENVKNGKPHMVHLSEPATR
jgi:integrase